MSEFREQDLSGSTFEQVDLSGATLRHVTLAGDRRMPTSFRNARGRSAGGTCCQTALKDTTSAAMPEREIVVSAGRLSESHRILGEWCSRSASARMPDEGSTAMTS